MRLLPLLAAISSCCLAFGCSTAPDVNDPVDQTEHDVTSSPELRNYAKSTAWASSCEGSSITQADLSGMLGDQSERVLGRFAIATRDFCSPWVNGASSCGPSGESAEAWNGDAKFAFGIDPNHAPQMAAWRFNRGPLLVHDGGVVLARRVGDRVVVQLVGDVSAVDVGTGRDIDGRVTGSVHLRGRLLSSDLVRTDNNVRGELRAAMASEGTSIEAADINVDTLRWTSPPAPLADLAQEKSVYGVTRWSGSGMWSVEGKITTSCLRLTDGMKPAGTVVVASFESKSP